MSWRRVGFYSVSDVYYSEEIDFGCQAECILLEIYYMCWYLIFLEVLRMNLLEMMLQMLPQKWFGSKQVSCCNDQVDILIRWAFAAQEIV